MKKEIWKDAKGYEGKYQVSNEGRVKSLARHQQNHGKLQFRPEEIKIPSVKDNDYLFTSLWENGKGKSKYIHRLVSQAFILDYSEDLQVNHKDMDRQNNNLDNLEMVSSSKNHQHAKEFKGKLRGVRNKGNSWIAHATKEGKYFHIGCFKTALDAYNAYRDFYFKENKTYPWSEETQKKLESVEEYKVEKKFDPTFKNVGKKRGVHKKGNKYYAIMWDKKNKKQIFVGSFNDKEEAYSAFYDYYLNYYGIAPWQ